MRIIASFETETLAKRFSVYLSKINIENSLEKGLDPNKKSSVFNIWVLDEDDIFQAENILKEFSKNPSDNKFDVRIEEVFKNKESDSQQREEEIVKDPLTLKKKYPYKTTFLFLFLCVILFFLNFSQELTLRKKYNLKQLVLLTPLQETFLFDLTEVRLKLNDVIIKYRLDTLKKLENPPIDAKEEIETIENIPTFQGLYHIILSKLKKQDPNSGPVFEKIRQGQVWRLFTPCLMHGGFLHILFNMLWLVFLGKQIEPRLKFFKYVIFVLIVGIISNIVQYLMGGPYFLGFSGVIMGMAGFIYIRQKVAPWEGYTVPKGVFLFIAFYVLAMFVLQITSFIFQVYKPSIAFAPAIANAAHISGAIIGMVLAKIPFFAWRENE